MNPAECFSKFIADKKNITVNSINFKKHFYILFFISIFLYYNSVSAEPAIKLGIDVLTESELNEISGKKVILFTNSTGRNSEGELTAEVLSKNDKIKLVSIISPEHGFFTCVPAGEKVENDTYCGIPVYSLYGEMLKPGNKVLSGCDAVIIDIQDIGVRSYTYISTTFKIMQAAAENKKPVYVLDRPNPIGGNVIDGNVLEKGMESFVGIIPVAYIHGMTIGELAAMINGEGWLNESLHENLKCDLHIIKMRGYTRSMIWEDTGLMWFPTSPNVPTVNSVRGLAMLGIFGELGFMSIGIGTSTPFQLIGSPDFDWLKIKEFLNYNYHAGIKLSETRFNPQFGMNSGKTVNGIFINFTKNDNFKPYSAGIELMLSIRHVYPGLFNPANIKDNSKNMFQKVTGTTSLFNALFNNIADDNVLKISRSGLDDFIKLREKYLIYKD